MEKKITQKSLNDNLRNKYLAIIKQSFEQLDEEVLQVASNEFAIPTLDEQGNDSFITIKVSVPNGSRDGSAYDGYELANEYKNHIIEKEEKAKIAKETKEKKIAKDKAKREQLAKSKAEHEQTKTE